MSIYLFSSTQKKGTHSLPMIAFTLYKKKIDLTSYDTLLFTSKQAVKSAYTLNLKAKELPALAIGSATAKQIVSLGGNLLYQAKEFYGKALSEDIIEKFKEKRILYLRPKVVSFDAKIFLEKAGVCIEEEIIYETSCMSYTQKDKPMKNAILIFTSPSTIRCFLSNFDWDESYTAVVIGKATQKYLPSKSVYEIANEPLISSCIEKAKEISLTSNSK